MSRFRRLVEALRSSSLERDAAALEDLAQSAAAMRSELADVSHRLNGLAMQVAETRQRAEAVMETHRRDLDDRVGLAGMSGARLLSDAVVLDGSPSARLRVRRVLAGAPVERLFARWMGITRCVSAAPDVRALWEGLLAREARCADGTLRSIPSTILDVPGATLSRTGPPVLHVSLRQAPQPAVDPSRASGTDVGRREGTVAVPRFTYAFPPRKVRNFSHWLLDCAPQVVALLTLAPDAVFLLPHPLKGFQRSTLSLLGLTPRQVIPWEGDPVNCAHVLILESDGRAGGGRPLSLLVEMRRLLAEGTVPASDRRTRRIFVSRRDAKAKRRWVSNESEVEALFESRGFEVLRMADHPLHELVRIFREARVVAGLNGAGLAHILFSPPGTHVIVLFSDSLIRWYADEDGARALWADDDSAGGGQLAALGDSPRFYAHVAATFEQWCHSFVGADDAPLEALSDFLDEVLSEAACV